LDGLVRIFKSFSGEAGLLLLCLLVLLLLELRSLWKRKSRESFPHEGAWRLGLARDCAQPLLLAATLLLLSLASLDGFPELFARPLLANPGQASEEACSARKRELVIVLGGGAAYPRQLGEASFRRVQTTVTLVESLEESLSNPVAILFSGGATFPETGVSEANLLHETFLRYAKDAPLGHVREIFLEDESTTTYENLLHIRRDYAALLEGSRVWLVTSAEHMVRARLTARGQGLPVCPYPSVPVRYRPVPYFGFSTLAQSAKVLHEYIGIATYALLGRFSPD
jgi:uncharacterized SAM-binding protein YcdF (DUF218 family)